MEDLILLINMDIYFCVEYKTLIILSGPKESPPLYKCMSYPLKQILSLQMFMNFALKLVGC